MLQSYYAQIYLGSPQNTNDIRSNNDGYLRNQIVRGELCRRLHISMLVVQVYIGKHVPVFRHDRSRAGEF